MPHYTDTELDALEQLAELDVKLHGGPWKGRHVGGGRHVDMPEHEPGPGWTTRRHVVTKHPKRAEWAYPIDDQLVELLEDDDKRGELTAGQLQQLDTAKGAAKELSKDWTPDDDDDLEPAQGEKTP